MVIYWCFLTKQILQLKTFVNFNLVLKLTMALKRCVLWLSYEINIFCNFNSIFIKSTGMCVIFRTWFPLCQLISLLSRRFYFIPSRVESRRFRFLQHANYLCPDRLYTVPSMKILQMIYLFFLISNNSFAHKWLKKWN